MVEPTSSAEVSCTGPTAQSSSPKKASLLLPTSAVSARAVRRRAEGSSSSIRKPDGEEPFLQKRKLCNVDEALAKLDYANKASKTATATTAPGLTEIISTLRTDPSDLNQLRAITLLRQVLASHTSPPIQEVIDLGALPLLVQKLSSPMAVMRLEAAWALTNASVGTSPQTLAVVQAGAPMALLRLLSSSSISTESPELVVQALWALANMAGDSHIAIRNTLLSLGVVDVLGQLYAQLPEFPWDQATRQLVLRHFTWLMSALCRGDPAPPLVEIECAFDFFAQVTLGTEDTTMLRQALWGISYLLEGSKEDQDATTRATRLLTAGFGGEDEVPFEHPLVMKLVRCLRMQDRRSPLPVPALRVIGAIASTAASELTDVILTSGALQALKELLEDPQTPSQVQRDAAWTISNVLAGSVSQAVRVVDEPGLLDALCAGMESSTVHKVRRECAWALSNLMKRGAPVLSRVDLTKVTQRAVEGLLNESDVSLQRALLDGLEVALTYGRELSITKSTGQNHVVLIAEEAGLVEGLEELQIGHQDQLWKKASCILERFFGCEGHEPISPCSDKTPSARTPSAICGGSPKRPAAYQFGA